MASRTTAHDEAAGRDTAAVVEVAIEMLSASGLVVDTVQRSRLYALLAQRAATGRPVPDEQLAGLLTPILAGTAAEQKLCHEVFARLLRQGEDSDGPPPILPDPDPSKEDRESVRTGTSDAHGRLRRWWQAAALLSFLVLLIWSATQLATPPLPQTSERDASPGGATIVVTDLDWIKNYPIEELERPKQRPWNRSPRWYYTEYSVAKWAVVLLPTLLVALGLGLVWRRMVSQLRRDAQHEALRSMNWHPGSGAFRYGTRRQNAALQPLRKLPRAYAQVLDVEATALASASAGGLLQPRYALAPVPTEFVALIDRRSAGDHLAAFNHEVCRALSDAGLSVDRLEFNLDPSVCRVVRSGEYCKLEQVVQRFGDSVLLLFADVDTLVDPSNNQWLPALEALLDVRRLVLITPRAQGVLSPLEQSFAHRFRAVVHRNDPANWPSLVKSLIGPPNSARPVRPGSSMSLTSESVLQTLLRDRPGRWIQPSGVNHADASELALGLRASLSEGALRWLAVTAVYPVLRWPLTLAMQSWANDRRASQSNQERMLLELCRLPWFRQGAFPEWMRKEFLHRLQESERRGALSFLRHLLGRALGSKAAKVGALQVDLEARKSPLVNGNRPDRVMVDLLLKARALPDQLSVPSAWLMARRRKMLRMMAGFMALGALGACAMGLVGLAALPIDECDLLAASDADAFRVGSGGHHVLLGQPRIRAAAIDACERAVLREPGNGRYKYQLARALNQSESPADLHRSFELATEAAELGHPAGLHLRGILLFEGLAVRKNLDLAEADLRKAIDLGNFVSWGALGKVYQIRGDRKREFELNTKAVDAGSNGVFDLAWFYREGVGVEANEAKYLELLRLGVARQDGASAGELSYVYCCGVLQDTPDNYEQSVRYSRLGIQWSLSKVAARNLATRYRRGQGVEHSNERATYWNVFAAKQGFGPALAELADMMIKGEAEFAPGHAPPSQVSAGGLLERAASQGDAQGQYGYARWLEEGERARRPEVLTWYRKAADQGHADARKALRRLTEKEGE